MRILKSLLTRALPILAVAAVLTVSCVFDAPNSENHAVDKLPLRERLSIDDARLFFDDYAAGFGILPAGARNGNQNCTCGDLHDCGGDCGQEHDCTGECRHGDDCTGACGGDCESSCSEGHGHGCEGNCGNGCKDDCECKHSHNHGSTRSGEGDDIPAPEISWGDAIYSAFFGYEVIEAHIENMLAATFDNTEFVEGEQVVANTVIHLLAMVDEDDEVMYRVVHITPSESFMAGNDVNLMDFRLWDTAENFSGELRLFETTGEFVKGFVVEAGILTGYIIPLSVVEEVPEGAEIKSTRVFIIVTEGDTPATRGGMEHLGGDLWGTDAVMGPTITAVKDILDIDFERGVDHDDYKDDPTKPKGGGGGGGGSSNNNNNNDKDEDKKCDECGYLKKDCQCCTVCKKYPCECVVPEDWCSNMNQKLKDPGFMAYMRALQGRASMGNKREYGYKFRLGPNGKYIFSDEIVGSGDSQHVSFEGGLYGDDTHYDGAVHSHPPGFGNIFSFLDLLVLYNAGWAANNQNSFLFGLTTEDGIYFIQIEDMGAYNLWVLSFTNSVGRIRNPDPDKGNEMLNSYKLDYGIGDNTPSEEAEKAFLKYLLENNTGLRLIKYDESSNAFEQLFYLEILDNIYHDRCVR